jgi:tRNA(Ile)-lysidine synthase
VSFTPADLVRHLDELERHAATPNRYLVALSGGLDSTVLLHMLSRTQKQHGKGLLAIHVDHQLQTQSHAWAEHCGQFAAELNVDFLCETVNVVASGGDGPEAAARDARYEALARHIVDTDWLLSAHHQDDQAETLFLNLLRGSGPTGLAGMRPIRHFSSAWLARPLLDVPRHALLQYATENELGWIEDPSNEADEFDRNFLRNDVLPIVRRRWPQSAAKFARSAELARDASNLLGDLAVIDFEATGGSGGQLPIDTLGALSPSRQKNLLRFLAQKRGLPVPGAQHLKAIVEELMPAREDAEPLVSWPGGEARRFRNKLYLQPANQTASFDIGQPLDQNSISIGPTLGELSLAAGPGPGLSEAVIAAGLSLRRRVGGERIKPLGQLHTRTLKKLLQEENVVPWLRDSLPLVYSGEQLVAVADLWIAADVAAENGSHIHWQGRPELY